MRTNTPFHEKENHTHTHKEQNEKHSLMPRAMHTKTSLERFLQRLEDARDRESSQGTASHIKILLIVKFS